MSPNPPKSAHDHKSVTFHLRPEARFSDGSPVTADDVVASLTLLKDKGHPQFQAGLQDVKSVVAIDAHTVRYEFEGQFLRDLPLIVASLPIFSKTYYEAHSFEELNLNKPLGSGPYEIAEYNQGSFVQYRRRKDYWGASLPVNVGRHNLDEIRYEYFRDRGVSLEALKAKAYDMREEFTSKSWATEYDIPQVRDKKILRADFARWLSIGRPGSIFSI